MVIVRRHTIIELKYRKEFVKYCQNIVYDDNLPISRAVSAFRRKPKRPVVLKEQYSVFLRNARPPQ